MKRKQTTALGEPSGESRSSLGRKAVPGLDHELRIGPAGWAYKDWSGMVYPAPRPKGFHEAAYLAQFFDTIEINASFYRPLRAEQAEQWIEWVAGNPRFLFTAKLWQRFTHDPAPTLSDEREVRLGFDVLMGEQKLGAVLAQFPFAFHRTRDTTERLKKLLQRFAQYPLAVEFRHASWDAPETFALLREHRAAICNIDQPIIGRSLGPSAQVTSEIAYVRLHGRRYDTWFANSKPRSAQAGAAREETHHATSGKHSRPGPDDFFPQNEGVAIPTFERYNYLYSEEELQPWAERVRELNGKAKSTYVVTNNHYLGKGVVNALQLISILKGAKIAVPETLREPYPELNEIAVEPPEAPTLFAMR